MQAELTQAPSPLVIRWLGKSVDWLVICIGAALAALIFINVALHAFGKDLAWLTELGELLMVWVTFLGGAAAAQRGAHPGEELLATEWLRNVVIGTSIEGINLRRLIRFARQHDDWRGAAGTNLMNDVEPVATRHGEVKKDESRLLGVEDLNRLNAVVGGMNFVVASC